MKARPEGTLGSATLRSVGWLACVSAALAWLDTNHYPPWPSFHGQLWAAVALLLGAAYVALDASQRSEKVQVGGLALLCYMLAATPWLQWLGGHLAFAGDAWIVSAYFAAAGASATVGRHVARRHGLRRLIDVVAAVLVVSATLSAWIALHQLFDLTYLRGVALGLPINAGGRVFANLAQPNHLALLLAMGALAFSWLHSARRISAVAAWPAIALLMTVLALTGSRAGLLAMLIAVAWLTLIVRASGHVLPRAFPWVYLALVALALAVDPAIRWFAGYTTEEAAAVQARLGTAGSRWLHWVTMLDASWQQPWAGFGWNQIGMAQYSVIHRHEGAGETLTSSHNAILDLMASLGAMPGLALAALGLVGAILVLRRSPTVESHFGCALLLVVVTGALLEFPHEYLYFLIPACVVLGGIQPRVERALQFAISAPVALAAVLVGTALTTVLALDYVKLEAAFRELRAREARIFLHTPPQRVEVTMLTQLNAYHRFALDRPGAMAGVSAESLNDIRRVVLRFPHWTALMHWANVLAVNGQPDAAQDVLRRICKLNNADTCSVAKQRWAYLTSQQPTLAVVEWPN
jgi:hypothetical protein